MLEWIRTHDVALWWLAALSIATFVGSLILIPMLVVRIPPDYFTCRTGPSHRAHHPIRTLCLFAVKNVMGILFMLAGIAMLVLPGQGVLTILIGLVMIDFPGKFSLERWLVRRPTVSRAIAWFRDRAGRPPLQIPSADETPQP